MVMYIDVFGKTGTSKNKSSKKTFSVCNFQQEVDLIRGQVQQLISLPMWMALQPVSITLGTGKANF